ncbi:MAG: 3-coathanger stack domain-containing protein, partial [Bacteroidota bacterium]
SLNNTPLQQCDYTYLPNGFLQAMNDVNNLGGDLFALALNYDMPTASGASSQRNGNISEAQWKTLGDNQTNVYGYEYDYLNRLTSSVYGEITASGYTATNQYNTGYTYDPRGNILTLNRVGMVGAYGSLQSSPIDDLDYTYAPGSNRLVQVTDAITGPTENIPQDVIVDQPINDNQVVEASNSIIATSTVDGSREVSFRAGNEITLNPDFEITAVGNGDFEVVVDESISSGTVQAGFIERSDVDYAYDANGNLTSSLDKGITHIEYNYLNLPNLIQKGDNVRILFSYTADGLKLQSSREEWQGSAWVTVESRFYLPGLEINNDDIEALYHVDGRIVKTNGAAVQPSSFQFQYTLKDHLGNTRVLFKTEDNSTPPITSDIIQPKG